MARMLIETPVEYKICLVWLQEIADRVSMGHTCINDGKFTVSECGSNILIDLNWRIPNGQIMFRTIQRQDSMEITYSRSFPKSDFCHNKNGVDTITENVVEACYETALGLFVHELKEQIKYNGKHIHNPHPGQYPQGFLS